MADVDASIQSSRTAAEEAQNKAISYTDAAQTAAQGYVTTGPVGTVTPPAVNIPPFNPNIQLADTFKSDFDTQWAGMEAWVRTLMNDWINTHFPQFDQTLATSEDAWMKAVIDAGYSGIPIALENAIWNRARGKEMIEAVRLEEEAFTQFAARGFSMPPGALADRVLQVQQDATNKSSTIARELAIKQMEIAVDMVKLAIAEATKIRLGMAQALGDFIRAWLAVPQAAADIAKAKAQMNQVLWQSSADYVRALVAVASLDVEAQKANIVTNLELQKIDVTAFNESIERKVRAAIEAATVLGQSASAALGAQNTLVGAVTTITTKQ